jgi:hypothetical protein
MAPKSKNKHPGLFIGGITKKLGDIYRDTIPGDKAPHEQKAAKLKENLMQQKRELSRLTRARKGRKRKKIRKMMMWRRKTRR